MVPINIYLRYVRLRFFSIYTYSRHKDPEFFKLDRKIDISYDFVT